jgi:hypothetical protein
LPAQFNVTFPKSKGASFLINIGAAYDIPAPFKHSDFSVTGEYHRNSLTDSAQNNLQLGVSLTSRIWNHDHQKLTVFLVMDPKYSWDGIEKTNSAESNFLLTPKFKLGDHVNFGKPSDFNQNAQTLYISGYVGTQVQQVFASDTTQPKGFILRPLVKGLFSFAWNRRKDNSSKFDGNNPLVKLYFDVDWRRTFVNSTHDGEGFSHLFNTGVNYYLPTKGVKVSFGVSFVEGSDFFSGLKPQQYFLVSFNLSLGS